MSSKRRTLFSISILIFFVILLHYVGALGWLENLLRKITSPLSGEVYSLSVAIGGEEEKFASVEDLKMAYRSAVENLLSNRAVDARLQLLEQENQELRTQLNFIQAKKFKSIGADVIGKNIDPVGNTLIINRGTESGIIIDSAVVTGEGILVGKVVKIDKGVSIVRLINDNQSKIAATVLNQEKSLGVVEGGYGISVQMNYIPQNETINVGETIITSGLEGNVPRGLLIGTIEAVEKEAHQPFQKAMIKPFASLEKIRQVSIILSDLL